MARGRQARGEAGFRCHVCGEHQGELIAGFPALCRVSSDSKPWKRGGRLGVCGACGNVQKVVDAAWQAEVAEIYGAYDVYYQAGGAEQKVFVHESGQAAARSDRILEYLVAGRRPPPGTRVLDVGCGNGAMLRACAALEPSWALAGTELTGRYCAEVEAIRGVEKLYTTPPELVPGVFGLITMIHVLEHIPDPGGFLARMHAKLGDDGLLVLEVPHYRANPFDLLVADHCSHFSAGTIGSLLQSSGYDALALDERWIPKELTVIARRLAGCAPCPRAGVEQVAASVAAQVRWLTAVAEAARDVTRSRPCGIFGTSIAATWLFAEVEGAAAFFVDEDPARAGLTYLGKPVLHPRDVREDATVLLALPPGIAETLSARLGRSYPGRRWLLLPQAGGRDGR